MSKYNNTDNTSTGLVQKIIQKNRKYIGYFFIFLSVLSFGFFWVPEGVKASWEKAILVLWIILWIPILARVFGLWFAKALMPLRKELGILMGTLAFVHSAAYIAPYPSMMGESYFWLDNTTVVSYLAIGFVALLLTIPLTLTSSTWAMQKMGRYWKMLHRSVYVIIILSVLHVVLLKWYIHLEVAPLILLVVYFGFKILEWRGFSFAAKSEKTVYPKWQKWLCVPCGYIYDPVLWDEEDGIKAGTEFSDIPDDWRCPLCGVTKADFVPVDDTTEAQKWIDAKIIEKIYLNPVTLKLVIEMTTELTSVPGQFATFNWSDSEGDFTRSYSIAEHTWRQLTFLIKLTELGRGARLLKDVTVGESVSIRGIFGGFVLQDSANPKVFIATGTGLAPIYNMIQSLRSPVIPGLTQDTSGDKNISETPGLLPSQEWQKPQIQLYFTVSTGNELFYTSELNAIEGLDLNIHTTREEVPGCNYGRVNIDDIVATPDTEWYLCGSPKMVEEAIAKLRARGYEKVYSEEFN